MSTVLTGIQGKLYYLSTGTRATWGTVNSTSGAHEGAAPSNLAEVAVVRSVTLNSTTSEADVSRRASTMKLIALALDEYSVDVEIPWDPADATFTAFRNARVARKPIAVAILDGDKAVAGSQGLWADFVVTQFTREEPIDKEMLAKVTLKPTASAVAPEWIEVTGS